MKLKIIHILPHLQDYKIIKSSPDSLWQKSEDGILTGISGNDWPNLISIGILKITDNFIFEVWQPELNIKKEIEFQIHKNLIHKLIPAEYKRNIFENNGKSLYINNLIDKIKNSAENQKTIVHLHGYPTDPINLEIIINLKKVIDLPIIQMFHGNIFLPYSELTKVKKPKTYLKYLFQLIKLSRYYNKNVDVVTYQNSFNLESLNKHYTGKIYQINMGCDFSYWKKGNKNEKRKILNIDKNKLVLFTSSRLVREKQIDKLIELIDELDINNGYNFLLIVSGTGDKNYETELIQKANRLSVKSKIQFIGYVVGDELLNYYQAADVIISTSITEGGPVSSMKALACELPIFTTETGLIAEILKKNKSGFVVSKSNPSDWLFYLKKLLENELPKKLDYNLSVSMFDWINVSNKLYNIYKSLYHRYYDDK